jgi:hypothetical protein
MYPLKKFRIFCLTGVCLFTNLPGIADGLRLVEGSYPGRVLVFKLNAEEKDIENHRTYQLELSIGVNVFTTYVLELTGGEAGEVSKRV